MTKSGDSFLEILGELGESRADQVAFRLAGPDSDIELTYAELAARVARLGTGLRKAGFGPGQRIALCMENRPAWPVAYLSIWYCGATAVPIDPALEAPAVARILEHSEARLLMGSHQHGDKLRAACEALEEPPRLVDADADGYRWDGAAPEGFPEPAGAPCGDGWSALEDPDVRSWSPVVAPDAPATITYTSGTTGLPKGVVLSHGALRENVRDGLTRIEITADSHVLGVLPLFHALPIMCNFLGPMAAGAEVTFLTELNPDRIIAAFPRFGITLFACVPLFFYRFHDRVMKGIESQPPLRRTVARGLLRFNRFARRRLHVNLGPRFFHAAHAPFGPELRMFLSGGAKFDPAVSQDFIDLGFNLLQGYGLTEASAGLTAHPTGELDAHTVGRALDQVEVRIDAPDAEGIGEIVARGPNLMEGYFKNPEATAETIRDGWLHTGDLGKLRDDGHLMVTGRAKDMIVLASGKNIYPEELEAYYGKSDLVEEICVLGMTDPRRRGAERLHAVVVPNLDAARERGQANLREEIKWAVEGLGLSLPGPQRLTSLELRMEPLPRTTTRKLKRYELKREILERGNRLEDEQSDAVDDAPAAEEVVDEAPWSHQARSLIAQHAKVEGVQRRQHLDIDLGLESLERVELQADLEAAFGVELPEEAAGEVQTVGDLLDLLEKEGADSATGKSRRTEDAWRRVLADSPPGIEPYLKRRVISPMVLFLVARTARLMQRLFGFRVAGLENIPTQYPFMVTPNHVSFTDPFAVAMALPWRVFSRVFFVGYAAYFRGPVLGWLGRIMRTVPIDQNRNLEGAMQAAAAGLRREMVLGIFPEGARSADGTAKEFRRGTGILAQQLEVPVVPVGLWGTFEMWPREGRYRPHRAAIVFGEPMAIEPGESPGAFVRRLREEVITLSAAARELAG
jgi:long-chain acyl-CoA synthetase